MGPEVSELLEQALALPIGRKASLLSSRIPVRWKFLKSLLQSEDWLLECRGRERNGGLIAPPFRSRAALGELRFR